MKDSTLRRLGLATSADLAPDLRREQRLRRTWTVLGVLSAVVGLLALISGNSWVVASAALGVGNSLVMLRYFARR